MPMRPLVPLALLLLAALPFEAQKSKAGCAGEPADSAVLAGGPVFRDCEVDRPAELRTGDLEISNTPPPAAASAASR